MAKPKRMPRVEVYSTNRRKLPGVRRLQGQRFQWRLIGGNGEKMARGSHGPGYASRRGAVAAFVRVKEVLLLGEYVLKHVR